MSIKKELLSGTFYTAISKYSGMLVSLIIAGILARMLSPEDFGTVAIATVIISFFSTFSEFGIGPAIIQNKELDKKDIQSIFSFTIWIGIIISLLFWSISWGIGNYYKNQILITICQLLSINLFFATINIVPNAIIYRNKEFKYIATRTFFIQIITGSIAILAVFLGAGIYALVISPILSALLIFLLNFRKYPLPIRLYFKIDPIKKISNYSFYQFLFNLLNYFGKNIDKLIIGKYMGMNPLGYYEKSYRLMMLPLQNVAHVLGPVMHPIFSEMQAEKKTMLLSYEKIIHFLAYISFPLSTFLFFTAREITLIIFGDQWYPSIPIFQILSICVGIQILLNTSGAIFQAGNDTRSLFICGVFTAATFISAVYIGVIIFKSLKAIAILINIATLLNFVQCYITMYKITFKTNMISFWKQLLSPCIVTCLTAGILYITSLLVNQFNIYLSITIKLVIFIIIFAIYTQLSKEFNLIKYLKRKTLN